MWIPKLYDTMGGGRHKLFLRHYKNRKMFKDITAVKAIFFFLG